MTATLHDRGGGIAELSLGTDAAPHLGRAEIDDVAAIVARITDDASVRAVIVTGGERRFCLGAARETLIGEDAAVEVGALTRELPRSLLSIPVPTIAAMAGHAVGGGFALGLWCDHVLLGAESLYTANFVTLGFTPGMGATVVLEEWFGSSVARDLLMTGRRVTGRELAETAPQAARLVHRRAEVRTRALDLAATIAEAPRDVSVLVKRALVAPRRARFEAAHAVERALHDALLRDPTTRARIHAAYGLGADEENAP